MRKRITILGVVAVLLALTATPATAERPDWSMKDDATIVGKVLEISGPVGSLDSYGGDFDVLREALVATGAIGLFDGTAYTVFAPTDQAFYDLTGTNNDLDALNATVAVAGGLDGVLGIVAYHVAHGVRVSPSVLNAPSVKMMTGGAISADGLTLEAANSTATIIAADVRVADGIIHVVDSVLLP